MKKTLIPILIAFVTLSLAGLVVIQIFWANETLVQGEDQFNQSVDLTLAETARIIEAEDAKNRASRATITQRLINKLKQIEEEQRQAVEDLFHEAGAMFVDTVSDEFTMPDVPTVQEFGHEIGAAADSTMAVIEGGIEWISNVDHWDFWNNMDDIKESAGEWVDTMVNDFWEGVDATGSWLDNKAETASQWVDEIFNLDIDKPLAERLDVEEIDSILNRELTDRGIKTEFVFAVFDGSCEGVLIPDSSERYINEIGNSEFAIEIFPQDRAEGDPPSELRIYFPDQQSYMYSKMYWVFGTTAVLIIMLIAAVSYSIVLLVRQKKLSDIKNDFISNMTHELKTPISTIALASEALNDKDISYSDMQRESYIRMIGEENKRLGTLVESVLQTSILEKGELKINPDVTDLHELIETAVNNLKIRIDKSSGSITLNLHAANSTVVADKIHVLNVITNLLDNAIKYTVGPPEIVISTENTERGIIMAVKDNGIGISKENQRKIFDKLFRVPTGNVHDVKGFGLGLSYVSAIVNLHNGGIEVISELDKGSTFRVYWPFEHLEHNP